MRAFFQHPFIVLFLPPILVYFFQDLLKRVAMLWLVYLAFFFIFGDISFREKNKFQFNDIEKTQSISIIALNLRYYSFGFNQIVNALNKMDADIYLLSENDISKSQIAAIKKKIAPKYFFMGQKEGTAIISRYPVISFKEISFPTRQASLYNGNNIDKMTLNPYRSFVHAIVDINGTNVHAISVRFIAGRPENRMLKNVLEWVFYISDAQQKEITFFLEYLKDLKGPVIFGGDLNATPNSVIIKKLTDIGTDLYLQDHSWGGFTFGTNFPPYSNFPAMRIDYIFAMNSVQPIRTKRMKTVVSDHYPIFAEVLIPLQ